MKKYLVYYENGLHTNSAELIAIENKLWYIHQTPDMNNWTTGTSGWPVADAEI